MTDYRRQGEMLDQQRLLDSNVTIIGSGPLANYTLCLLAGLGVGGIKILTQDQVTGFEKGEFLIRQDDLGRQKADCLEDRLSNINPTIRIRGRSIGPDVAFLGRPNVIVETTNDPKSKRAAAAIFASFTDCYSECEKLILASSDDNSCHVAVHGQGQRRVEDRIRRRRGEDQTYQEAYKEKRQGIVTSCIAASIVVDEIRKALHPLERDMPLETAVTFDWGTLEYHPGTPRILPGQPPTKYSRRALVVGAGGIGTYVALNLALSGIEELHIYDPDVIEPHNLNRQILYYEKIGEKKAATLAKRIFEMNPRIRAHAYDIAFGEEEARHLRQGMYTIMFSCVDSFSARKLLSNAAVRSQTPLVDGSVSAFDAFVDVYIPGITPCLDCRHDYTSLLALDNRPMSCADQDANVVMPNAMAAAMMVACSIHILNSDTDKPFATKRFIHASQRGDTHKFTWVPFMAEKDPIACGCLGGKR